MKRIPESELMNDPTQVLAYAGANFDEPHEMFMDELQRVFPEVTGRVLDLGCGAADISIRFAKRFADCQIDGIDGAPRMLEQAQQAVTQARLERQICLFEGLLPSVQLPYNHYDIIISNSLLHHLHTPSVLWESIKRFGKLGSQIFIMDLLRPDTTQAAKQITETYVSGEPKILQTDFFNSLCAAFLPEEVTEQLRDAGLQQLTVEVISDRHFIVYGRI